MLFFASRTSEHSVDGATRLLVLDRLEDRGLNPLIRAARQSAFEQALGSTERTREMERAIAAWTETEENSLYVRGDLFCVDDHVFYLIFGDAEDELAGMRAGIIYGRETIEPERRLEGFCRNVTDALDAARNNGREEGGATGGALETAEWKARGPLSLNGDAHPDSTGEAGVERRLALEALDDIAARRLLLRIEEAQAAGRAAELLAGETDNQSLVNRLSDVGLLKREVLVSCRKEGRSLFRLPSADMLTIITASNAMCSECGARIGDERVEELVMLTDLATTLLPDSTWLVNRLRSVLRELGVPDSAVSILPTAQDGEVQLTVMVSNEPFLFVLRDGEVAAAHAARALDKLIDTEAQHLVVVSTGKIQEDARVRLREHARRRTRGRNDVEVILVEGMDAASAELQHAFERAAQRALAAELCELDASLGFSAGYMVATRFRLMSRAGALKDLAESAVGALAGSLREI